MDKKVKVGIIGCGGIANGKHLSAMSNIKEIEITAFCDIIEERAVEAAKKYGTPDAKVYTDYKELLKDESLVAEVIDNTTSRGRTLRFLYDGSYEDFKETLFSLGQTPVPDWVKKEVTPEDAENFQTIFAQHEGAVSAPAAGLHFSRELFNRMILKDINKAFITLHMGIGHFREVDVEDLSKHKMDSERLIISEEAAELINKTKKTGHRVLAVGITTIRGLETYTTTNDEVNPYDGWTNKFIFPPYRFAIPDSIVSNFHTPGSTMLMSVAAFGGYENVMKAYKLALEMDYKFGPYGDALLII